MKLNEYITTSKGYKVKLLAIWSKSRGSVTELTDYDDLDLVFALTSFGKIFMYRKEDLAKELLA